MDVPVLVAAITATGALVAAVGTLAGNVFVKYKEVKDKKEWDLRDRKIPIYATCLSAIGDMVTRQMDRLTNNLEAGPLEQKDAELTRGMINWASPDCFLRYLNLRNELRRKLRHPDEVPKYFDNIAVQIAELVRDIRADLGIHDRSWPDKPTQGLGQLIWLETSGATKVPPKPNKIGDP
jgi:hypothetical protein